VAQPPRLIVLGGGFAALHTCRRLKKAMKAGAVDVTIVSRDNFLCAHGLINEMVTGRIEPGNILSPARRIFRPAAVHVAEIESIDLDAKKIVTSRDLDGARFELEYDQLVFALGTAENLEAYPGLAEHAFKLKKFEDCFRLRNHIIEMFELADIESDPNERRRLLTFVVAGGGFSGTELAAELADFVRLLMGRDFPSIRREECRVLIVHPGETLLPELFGATAERRNESYPKLVDYAMRHVEKLGVEFALETKVVGATPNEVHLSNGEHVPTRTIVSTVGTKPSPLLDGLDLPRDSRGRIVVDAYMRVEGRSNLWAGGDNAAVPHPKGGTCPPVAAYAIKHGMQIGLNISRALSGKPLRPFKATVLGQAVSIGRRTAVGDMKGIPMQGKLAWTGWRTVVLGILPSWDRRLHLIADWAIWPIVGRDLVQMGHSRDSDYEVSHNVYQPGELIAEKERPVRYVHVIIDGDVELVRRRDGAEETVRTIGPGEHFGRKWLEQTEADAVRAKSLVRTVALRQDQANRLQDVLISTGRLIARTGSFPTIDRP
jgi:NADH:ubiquinone reductase (H+-translocating)